MGEPDSNEVVPMVDDRSASSKNPTSSVLPVVCVLWDVLMHVHLMDGDVALTDVRLF